MLNYFVPSEVLLALVVINPVQTDFISNETDMSACKLSHLGIEYLGDVSKTDSWIRCQSWTSNQPHAIPETLTDNRFPEFSRKKARNFCRNPTRDPAGPWCYTMNTDLKYENCNLPLCRSEECRITGSGIEYAGKYDKTISGRKCLKWNKERKKVKIGNEYKSFKKFPKKAFPESNLGKTKKACRNPSGDIGGPWCFVENEETDEIEKDYCNIPFCHAFHCHVFTTNPDNYSHFTDFNDTLTGFNFGVRLWDSDSYQTATARLALTLFPLPLSGEGLETSGIGLEILISNNKIALTIGNKDKEFEQIPSVLKSEFTMFTISWSAPFISLSLENATKPIFLAEYKMKKNFLNYQRNIFRYYSAKGENVLWSFPFCMDDDECDVHTTTSTAFQQYWPLRNNEIQFRIRTFHSAVILFVATPTQEFPNLKLYLQENKRFTRVVVNFLGTKKIITELELPDLVNFWEWREFSVSFFANTMQFYCTKSVGTQLIFELEHEICRSLVWFSPASETISYWTFFCVPPLISVPKSAHPPECALNNDESNYIGTQDVTIQGLGCIPWGSKLLQEPLNFSDWNYCRDPFNEKKGTFCYVFTPSKQIQRQFCKLRRCKSEDCRMAGTGNDYVGKLTQTRSNKTCKFWFENFPQESDTSYYKYYNSSLFADLSLKDVEKFCRNPSRDPAGSWCYTTSERIEKDLCNVRDCDRPEENIIITTTDQTNHNIFILPEWKISGLEFALKQWNPDLSDGVRFLITSPHNDKLTIDIGAKANEKVILFYKGITKEKTFPHLISSGKWTDFWLKMRRGGVFLGFKGMPNSFFEYENETLFNPMFLQFGSINGAPMGYFFLSHHCHTENVTGNKINKFHPVGLWKNEANVHNNFSLFVRGTGTMILSLMNLLNTKPALLKITKNELIFQNYTKSVNETVFYADKWIQITVVFYETYLKIIKENTEIFAIVPPEPLLIYFFSVGAKNGWITWSANCKALDIDGPPRDGGWSQWSPWQCTVPCGGGEGFRTRNCTNPTPNIMGKLCPGSHITTGVCNDFICGDVSPTTLEKIRDSLQTHQSSFLVDEARNIVLENDASLLKIIKKESPDSYIEWTHNGVVIPENDEHRIEQNDNLILKNLRVQDSGVYVCMLYRINNKRVVFRVISVAVKSQDYDILTRATRSIVLSCNCIVLGYIYSDLSLKLFLNDKIYKDFGITMLAAVNTEPVSSLNTSHSGDWKCVVEQKDLKLAWTTNYLRILVRKAPNFYTNLMEDELTKPLFGWMKSEDQVFYALILIIIFVFLLIVIFLVIYFKCCRLKTQW